MNGIEKDIVNEKELKPASGMVMMILLIGLAIISIGMFISGIGMFLPALSIIAVLLWIVVPILFAGLKIIQPNEAAVYTLFGKYHGTISKAGFFWINPFCTAINPTYKGIIAATTDVSGDEKKNKSKQSSQMNKKVSLKAMTLNNEKQKVNDSDGNPIEIGVVVIWKVVNATKAVFNVDDYKTYVSTQTDSSIRQVAREYPYDISEEGDEKSLRGSSQQVSDELKRALQERVEMAGIEILDARIAHLAYAPEIAAAMLQRQQATAIIAARQKIVEGAVGMVEMAINDLSKNGVIDLDEERKAQMVTNLMVVLCGNKDPQPIVNSGSIY